MHKSNLRWRLNTLAKHHSTDMTPTKVSAALRIHGVGHLHDHIQAVLGHMPTKVLLKGGDTNTVAGAQAGATAPADLWILEAPLEASAPLESHIKWLTELIGTHEGLFLELERSEVRVDISCTCRMRHPASITAFGIDGESVSRIGAHRIGLRLMINLVGYT